MSKYVELAYPIFEGMPLHPVLPPVKVTPREKIQDGDPWNGTVFKMYTHSGTHVDAPKHFHDRGRSIDQVPVDDFVYDSPYLMSLDCAPNHHITVEELKSIGEKLHEIDFLLINTGWWKHRASNFTKYSSEAPSVSPEAAEFIRTECLNIKAVAIDTLTIEDLSAGAGNGYRVHNGFLNNEKFATRTILIYEDYNPEPVLDKRLKNAFATPLRIKDSDATPVNIFVEIDQHQVKFKKDLNES